jgi:ATP-dependent RNA helicase RhlB
LLKKLTARIHKFLGGKDSGETEKPEPDAPAPVPPAKSEDAVEPSDQSKKKRRRRRKKKAPADNQGTPEVQTAPEWDESWEPPADDTVDVIEGKTRFIDLDMPKRLMRGICDLEFTHCTPIQAGTLPSSLEGKDIAGRAQTGTGKTAAFLICAMARMLNNPKPDQQPGTPRALVLAPTRELAIQIQKDAAALGKYTGLRCLVVFGGMDHEKQRRQLEAGPVDILAGTPGRILDYSRGRSLNLRHCEFLVIDEADRMLDMGFIPDVRRIVGQLPPPEKRQTLLYSATLERSILRLVESWQRDPVLVEIEPEKVTTENVEQRFYSISVDHKMAVLLHLLKTVEGRALIFTNRKDTTNYVQKKLRRYGIACDMLSGDVAQNKRMRILEEFRSGKTPVIIATDVAARGIHVDDIQLVVNYDLPFETDSYVHRIGRTGRAGASGLAVTFVDEFGGYEIMELEEYLGDSIDTTRPDDSWLTMPPLPEGAPPEDEDAGSDRRGGRGSRRGGGGGRGGGRGGGGRRGGGGGRSGSSRRR